MAPPIISSTPKKLIASARRTRMLMVLNMLLEEVDSDEPILLGSHAIEPTPLNWAGR
ncbi:hypothetical protein [Paraburkholderia panacisoli]|uniref:hypothetical protein n=1 Tax=Paraburkholderia panacisoli TaxID=2603818 RepID=UPI00165FEBFA|nr:hypothetical protein [Paraburkholderia panacisoli]